MAETKFILARYLIDGSGAGGRRDIFMAVRDGIISAIGPAASMPRQAGAVIDDLSHCTILPALVDCSVELSGSPSVDEKIRLKATTDPARTAAMRARHTRDCRAHGVLGVADGNDNETGDGQEEIIAIRRANHLHQNGAGTADSAAGDFLKIAYSSNIEDDIEQYSHLSQAELCNILRHKGEKNAVVVANGRRQVAEALAAGCDAIEQGYDMGEDNLRDMASRNVLWIPSVLRAKNALDGASSGGDVCCRFSTRYVAPGKAIPGAEAFWQKILAEQLGQLALARELGVETAVGTGAGSPGILPGEAVGEEIKLFIKAGYPLDEAIHSASEIGARFFAMPQLGKLSVGRRATFLLTRGTVKQLPRKLAYLEGIYIDGTTIDTDKNPAQPAERQTPFAPG